MSASRSVPQVVPFPSALSPKFNCRSYGWEPAWVAGVASSLVNQPSNPATPNPGVPVPIVTGLDVSAGVATPPPLTVAVFVPVPGEPTTFTGIPIRPAYPDLMGRSTPP